MSPDPFRLTSREARFFPFALLRARVPWPLEARAALLNPSWAELQRLVEKNRHLPPRDTACICLAYRLFYLPCEEGAALLSLAGQAGGPVLAADFKPAERNLELPATFLARALPGLWPCCAAGSALMHFLRRGGPEGLARRAGLAVLGRQSLLGGAAVLLRLGPVARIHAV